MSSSGSSTVGKAASVIALLGLLVVGLLVYNWYCSECIFSTPSFGGGGQTVQGVVTAPGGAAPAAAPSFNFGSILAAILIVGLIASGTFVLTRGRRQPQPPAAQPPALPPGHIPPALPPGHDSTPTKVGPYDLGDAIEKLADSYTEHALIEGIAAKTIMEMAAVHQRKGPLESFGGLFGNFNSKSKNVIIPFAVPFPVFFADHKSVKPDWGLFKDVSLLALAEFALGNEKAAVDLIDDFKKKYQNYKLGHPPNEIIVDFINKGLFDPITKQRLEKIGYYFPGFKKGEIKAVGWYHNHPYTTGGSCPQDMLMKPSGSDPRDLHYQRGDLACQCWFQSQWSHSNPVSVLVATSVLKSDKVATVGEADIGFKFWKSTNCQLKRIQGKIFAGGMASVKYKIFCLDEDTYKWYSQNAPLLVENGIVLKWYETYYKRYARPEENKAKKIPMGEYKKVKSKSIFGHHFEEGKSQKKISKKAKKESDNLSRGKFE